MYTSITIERDLSYIGRKDSVTIENGDKLIPIIHEVSEYIRLHKDLPRKRSLRLLCQLDIKINHFQCYDSNFSTSLVFI